MRRLLITALLVSTLAIAPAADAWISMDGDASPPHTSWGSVPVPWALNSAGSADLGFATTETTLLAAFAVWSEPGCTAWETRNDGSNTSRPNGGDGRNVQGWVESGWPYGSGAIGVTSVSFGGYTTIREADIAYNGVNYTWTTTGGGGGSVDTQSIAAHEQGHFLGLGDLYGSSCAGEPTMCGVYSGGTGARTLAADDINGVCALYPSGATGCTTDDDCGPGEHCEGGYCVEDPEPGGLCDPCTTHEQCGDTDDLCLSGFPDGGMYCGQSCVTRADCPMGYNCMDVGGASAKQCIPATFDCSDIPGCIENSDCPEGQICQDGTCIPEPDCYDDGDCPEGEICRDGVCIPDPSPHLPWCSICTTHEDCGGEDDLCLAGFVDGTSRCGISCDSVFGDCGEGKVCYVFDDLPDQCIPADMDCSESPDGCLSDADCPPGQVCDGGTCVEMSSMIMTSGCGCTLAGTGRAAASALVLAALMACLGLALRRRS